MHIMTTSNTFMKNKITSDQKKKCVKAIGLWAPFYALRTAGFGCGNQTAGAFMPNRPYGQ